MFVQKKSKLLVNVTNKIYKIINRVTLETYSCKEGKLFDEKEKLCLPASNVKCSRKFPPSHRYGLY